MRLIFPTLVLLCLFPVSALTQPSPPPAPEKEAAIAAASCGGARDVGKGEQVPVVAEPAPVSLLGGKDGKVGALSFDWGVQLSARDPRIGGIVGLTFDDRLGIVAITDQGNWIVLDMQQGHTPKNVGISAMRGVGGAPAAILGAGQAQLVSVPGRNMVARYDLRDCGLNATAVPIAQTNVGVQAMATVAYGYTLFVGASNGGTVYVVRDFNGLDPARPITLDQHDLKDIPGYTLVSATGPDVIVPFNLLALWQGPNSQTVIQAFSLPHWADVPVDFATPPQVLAHVPLALDAILAGYDRDTNSVSMLLATRAKPGEPTYLFSLTWTPP
jgi:hypothetical protein